MSRGVYIGLDLPEDHHITLVHFGKVGVNKRLKPIEHFWDMAASNPWHIRGSQLRHAYVFGWGEKVLAMRVASEPIVPVRNRVLELAGRKQSTVFEPHITLREAPLPEFTHSYGLIFQYGDHIEKSPFKKEENNG